MKIPIVLLYAAFTLAHVRADPLSQSDREALLEKLEGVNSLAENTVDARFRLAFAAYRDAMTSDANAKEFYLKCLEKVEFTDEKRKTQDFRDWKRGTEGGKGGDKSKQVESPGFARALRHQLRWLVLVLKADSPRADREKLIPEARQIVADLFGDAKMLEGDEELLKRPVTATVFAKAYGIDKVEIKNWPLTPVDLEKIYDQLLLPPYRNPQNLENLRAAWLKRIEQEGAIRENWARYARRLEREKARAENGYENMELPGEGKTEVNETKIGMASSMRPPEFQKFLEIEVPKLLWQMEVDLYKSGDQSGAAVRMLAHISKYINHADARTWSAELKSLLKSQPEASAPSPPPARTAP